MPRRKEKLHAGQYYHLYNWGVDRGRVFFEDENYLFFLRKTRQYLLPAMDVIAYCLMPTHYHFLVRMKEGDDVRETSEASKTSEVLAPKALMRLAVSYTKAINKRYDRVGALFQGAYKAKRVDEEGYLLHLSRYIHLNPVKSGYVEQSEEWCFSSYREYVGLRAGQLPQTQIVMSQFASPAKYRTFVGSTIVGESERWREVLFEEK